jgi:Mu transposase, C-terminal
MRRHSWVSDTAPLSLVRTAAIHPEIRRKFWHNDATSIVWPSSSAAFADARAPEPWRAALRPPTDLRRLLAPRSAWAILALAAGDARFAARVADGLDAPEASRARARLEAHGLVAVLPLLPIVRDGLVPYPPSADDLRVLMGWTEQRTVTRRGVQLEYLLYSSDDLRALRGQTVVVKIDPRDLGQVWVRDPREGQRRFIAVPANHPGYAVGLSLWQHRVICRMANAEADRDNVALLVDTKARIQEIVEREWSTTRRTRSRQVLARWLNQQGGPNVVRSAQLAEQALEEATRTDGLPQRRSRSGDAGRVTGMGDLRRSRWRGTGLTRRGPQ